MDRRKQIVDALDEWCGGGSEKWDAVLRDLAFACAQEPAVLKRVVRFLNREVQQARSETGD